MQRCRKTFKCHEKKPLGLKIERLEKRIQWSQEGDGLKEGVRLKESNEVSQGPSLAGLHGEEGEHGLRHVVVVELPSVPHPGFHLWLVLTPYHLVLKVLASVGCGVV